MDTLEKPKTTPKDFFLWAGAMIALYSSAVAFIALMFDYINYAFPESLSYVAPYSSGMSMEIATLVVLLPLFLVLMRVIRGNIERDPSRADVWVRRWALVLTLFVAGATMAGDLITLLNAFLSGSDLTVRFLLKTAVVFLVAAGGFMHFLADLRGYWMQNPQYARAVGAGVGVLVLATIVAGFFFIGTPWAARQYRLDEQRVNDLMTLQSEITSFYQQKRALPGSLSQLNDPLLYYTVPVDPGTGDMYRYEKTADLGFRLCATFALESRTSGTSRTAPVMVGGKEVESSWYHGVGEVCFDRSIDPDFFPPTTK